MLFLHNIAKPSDRELFRGCWGAQGFPIPEVDLSPSLEFLKCTIESITNT